jgi:hypothetical protein
MIKQLLNSVLAKYRDLSVARRSIICLCLRHRQIIDLLATDKSLYFSQPRPIIRIIICKAFDRKAWIFISSKGSFPLRLHYYHYHYYYLNINHDTHIIA